MDFNKPKVTIDLAEYLYLKDEAAGTTEQQDQIEKYQALLGAITEALPPTILAYVNTRIKELDLKFYIVHNPIKGGVTFTKEEQHHGQEA